MKILGWIQNKINGCNGKKKPNSISATYYIVHEPIPCKKQELSEWPQPILAIGTLGNNNNLREDFTPTDAGNLHNDLKIIYFRGQVVDSSKAEHEQDKIQDQINQHFEENETFISDDSNDNINDNSGNLHPSSSLIPSLGKDLCLDDSKSSVIGKESLVFLLKKMFVCGGGFQPTHPISFKGPLPTESRMDKILRAMLHTKIYPHGGQRSAIYSTNKYLDNRPSDIGEQDLATDADDSGGSKWDKTDSEYIVLEI